MLTDVNVVIVSYYFNDFSHSNEITIRRSSLFNWGMSVQHIPKYSPAASEVVVYTEVCA